MYCRKVRITHTVPKHALKGVQNGGGNETNDDKHESKRCDDKLERSLVDAMAIAEHEAYQHDQCCNFQSSRCAQ